MKTVNYDLVAVLKDIEAGMKDKEIMAKHGMTRGQVSGVRWRKAHPKLAETEPVKS